MHYLGTFMVACNLEGIPVRLNWLAHEAKHDSGQTPLPDGAAVSLPYSQVEIQHAACL